MAAYAKAKPTIQDVRASLERNEIPVAMIIDREMIARARYKFQQSQNSQSQFLSLEGVSQKQGGT